MIDLLIAGLSISQVIKALMTSGGFELIVLKMQLFEAIKKKTMM